MQEAGEQINKPMQKQTLHALITHFKWRRMLLAKNEAELSSLLY